MITPSLNWQKSPDGLLPAVIQDAETGRVLMLGFVNEEALEATIKTELVTFYSRSKKRLWKKGEGSGNVLKLVSIAADCDRDALLILATPLGPACHTGSLSCFGNDAAPPLTVIGDLAATIGERSEKGNAKSSYTKSLLDGGAALCGAKVLEEAGELVRAALREGKQRTIEEAADLLYHMMVLLQERTIPLTNVLQELSERSRRAIEDPADSDNNDSTDNDIVIRGYRKEDFEQVWLLHEVALRATDAFIAGHGKWDEDLKNIPEVYDNNRGVFLVVERDNRIIAMGALRRVTQNTAEIKRMRVLPKYQGQGIGTKLLQLLEKRAEELGYEELLLDTSVRQKTAMYLYAKNGYREYKREMLGGLESIFMKKLLS